MGAQGVQASFLESLREAVGPRWVRTSAPDKLAYGRDCWPRGIILMRGGRLHLHEPDCVVQPGTEAEVAAVITLARAAGVPVVPYGAGSGVCGGALADRGGVVIDVKRLNAIEAVDAEAMWMRVGAGAIGQVVQTELERRGLTLGHFPSSLYCSSVGGYLAARSAGQYSSRFGKIEDMVQTLRLVTGTGEILDTAPGLGADAWGGGLDMTQLAVGSEGTLGVITAGTLRINQAPQVRIYRGWKCPTVEAGVEIMRRLMQAGLRPTVMRLYDEFDTLIAGGRKAKPKGHGAPQADEAVPGGLASGLMRVARRALGQDVELLTSSAPGGVGERVRRAGLGLIRRAVGQPLLLNQLTEVLPGGCMLVLGFEGQEAATRREAAAGFEIAGRLAADLGPGPGEHWLRNRFKVSYKQSPMFDAGAFVDTMEVATTWSNLMRLYYNVKKAVAGEAFIMAHFSHGYPEGASIYFTFAGFGHGVDGTLEAYERLWSVAQQAVVASGASPAHHHGVGISKAGRTGDDHIGGRVLFEGLKAAFDPDGIMNPGKVWSGQGGGAS